MSSRSLHVGKQLRKMAPASSLAGLLPERRAHCRSLGCAPNEQNGWGWICELTRGALVWGKGAPQIPPLRSPEFLSRLVALANFMRSSLTKTAHVDLSYVAKQEFGYATVGMTNLFGGTGLKASAHRVHSMLNLPTGESAAPNEQICLRDGFEKQTLSAFIPSLTWRRQVSRS